MAHASSMCPPSGGETCLQILSTNGSCHPHKLLEYLGFCLSGWFDLGFVCLFVFLTQGLTMS